MRESTVTIPSTFYRTDATIHSADKFINVQDLNRARSNHNILKAKRVRKVLYAQTLSDLVGYTEYTTQGRGLSERVGEILSVVPVMITPGIKELVVGMNFCTNDASDTHIYPCVHAMDELPVIDATIFLTAQSGGTMGVERVTVPLSRMARRRSTHLVTLFIESSLGSVSKAAVAVTDVGKDYITSTLGAAVGDVLHVSTRNDSTPRVVVGVFGNKAFVDPPWDSMPVPGTDQIEAVTPKSVRVNSITITEQVISSYNAQADIAGSYL